jgi:hypothetical protein
MDNTIQLISNGLKTALLRQEMIQYAALHQKNKGAICFEKHLSHLQSNTTHPLPNPHVIKTNKPFNEETNLIQALENSQYHHGLTVLLKEKLATYKAIMDGAYA